MATHSAAKDKRNSVHHPEWTEAMGAAERVVEGTHSADGMPPTELMSWIKDGAIHIRNRESRRIVDGHLAELREIGSGARGYLTENCAKQTAGASCSRCGTMVS
ncbi:MAG: hypothetical protein ABSH21_07065 [Verrucomicrobiia bacterium]|jgi:hypothetical protein